MLPPGHLAGLASAVQTFAVMLYQLLNNLFCSECHCNNRAALFLLYDVFRLLARIEGESVPNASEMAAM